MYAETKDGAQEDVFRLEKHGYIPLGKQIGLVKVSQETLTKGLGYVLSA